MFYFERWDATKYSKCLAEIKNIRKTYKYFPYLYSYDEDEEQTYHAAYMTAGQKLDAFVAIYDNKLVGISIGCPLSKDITICSELLETSLNTGQPYYFGDIIIVREFWGHGIANILYNKHLKHIIGFGYTKVLALLVERNKEDPRKPEGFKKTNLWDTYKFKPTDFTVTYSWNTVSLTGEVKSEEHTLRAYQKDLL